MSSVQPAERLRVWRVDSKLTLAKVAQQLGCSEAWVSLIERGIKVPGGWLALAIHSVMGIAPGEWPQKTRKRRKGKAEAA